MVNNLWFVSPLRIRVCSFSKWPNFMTYNSWDENSSSYSTTETVGVPGSLECCSNPRRGCEVNSLFGTLAAMFSVDVAAMDLVDDQWVISPPMNPPYRSVGEITKLILTSWGSWDLQVFFCRKIPPWYSGHVHIYLEILEPRTPTVNIPCANLPTYH